MNIDIRQTDSLTETEYLTLFHWGEDVFGANDLNLVWRMKTAHLIVFEDDRPVSHVGVLRHAVAVGGRTVTVGGVGGVVTLPEAQKKGYARLLMGRVAELFVSEWRVEAGLLFCLPRMVPFYGALGWERIEDEITIEQPGGAVKSPMGAMILSCRENCWPGGAVNLNSLPW
jgi:GNAT superfamily N-acetyltransferase